MVDATTKARERDVEMIGVAECGGILGRLGKMRDGKKQDGDKIILPRAKLAKLGHGESRENSRLGAPTDYGTLDDAYMLSSTFRVRGTRVKVTVPQAD